MGAFLDSDASVTFSNLKKKSKVQVQWNVTIKKLLKFFFIYIYIYIFIIKIFLKNKLPYIGSQNKERKKVRNIKQKRKHKYS